MCPGKVENQKDKRRKINIKNEEHKVKKKLLMQISRRKKYTSQRIRWDSF